VYVRVFSTSFGRRTTAPLPINQGSSMEASGLSAHTLLAGSMRVTMAVYSPNSVFSISPLKIYIESLTLFNFTLCGLLFH